MSFISKPTIRIFFGVIFFSVQLGLIATAKMRADRAFGFRMFEESSSILVNLFFEKESQGHLLLELLDGNKFKPWQSRVLSPELNHFGSRFHAGYGAEAQLMRFSSALEDVASEIKDPPHGSRSLVLQINVERNGRKGVNYTFKAPLGKR